MTASTRPERVTQVPVGQGPVPPGAPDDPLPAAEQPAHSRSLCRPAV